MEIPSWPEIADSLQNGLGGWIVLAVILWGLHHWANKWWAWHTTVKWPEEMRVRKEESAERVKRQDDWYSLMHKTVVGIDAVLMILGIQFPEAARAAAMKTIQEQRA